MASVLDGTDDGAVGDNIGFVAVHVGAGYHSPTNSELYKEICKQACLQARELLREKDGSALEAVTAAIRSLEDSPYTNAGTGSNLTVTGSVECDASMMDGKSLHYGAVGGVSGVRNPIRIAESLLHTQMAGNMSLGRIPPGTMVGDGAREWASKMGIPLVAPEALMTDASRRAFIKHKRKLDMFDEGMNGNETKHRRVDSGGDGSNGTDGCMDENTSENSANKQAKNQDKDQPGTSTDERLHETRAGLDGDDRLLDTVGAICVDSAGRVASAVSSGGIVLKQPGRLGQAALYACGCWAENGGDMGVGVSTSGCGEHLTKTLLAKECADCLKRSEDPTQAMSSVFKEKFLESPFIESIQQKLGGALALTVDRLSDSSLDVEVLWAHTTESMCLGFMSTADSSPKAMISRLPAGKVCGRSYLVESKSYRIQRNDAPDNDEEEEDEGQES